MGIMEMSVANICSFVAPAPFATYGRMVLKALME